MKKIIPRNLIKHLEWNPANQQTGFQPLQQNTHTSQPLVLSNGNLILREEISKYIQVGINGLHGTPVVISPFELEGFNNLTYNGTHVKLLKEGLYMPTPKIFMTHFNNVVDAYG